MELCRQCLVRKCWHHQKDLWITLDRLGEELEDVEDCDSGIGDDSPPQTPSDDGKYKKMVKIQNEIGSF